MAALSVESYNPPNPTGNPNIGEQSDTARETQAGIRKTLRQAIELKELAYNTAKAIQPKIKSLSEANEAQAMDSQEARAIAQSVTALCKAFADMVTIIRIERGKPLPGSLRPEAKPTKRKQQPTMFSETKPE